MDNTIKLVLIETQSCQKFWNQLLSQLQYFNKNINHDFIPEYAVKMKIKEIAK